MMRAAERGVRERVRVSVNKGPHTVCCRGGGGEGPKVGTTSGEITLTLSSVGAVLFPFPVDDVILGGVAGLATPFD